MEYCPVTNLYIHVRQQDHGVDNGQVHILSGGTGETGKTGASFSDTPLRRAEHMHTPLT